MPNDETQVGMIAGRAYAPVRFADALLRSLGVTQATLRLANPSKGDDGSQLGLEAPESEDVQIAPAVVLALAPSATGSRRIKVMLSASAVHALAKKYGVTDISDWLLTAEGVLHHGQLMHIDSVTVDHFLGADCLYHLTATE